MPRKAHKKYGRLRWLLVQEKRVGHPRNRGKEYLTMSEHRLKGGKERMKKHSSNTGSLTEGVNSVESQLKKSIAYIKEERFCCAKQALEKAVNLKPDSMEAYCLLWDLLMAEQVEYFLEPEEIFRKMISLDPDCVVAYRMLIFIYSLSDVRDSELVWAHREALRINPNSGFDHYHLGLSLRSLKHLEEAEAEFQEAIRTLSDTDKLSDEAHFLLGRTHLDLCHKQYGILKERKYFRANELDVLPK